MPNVIHVFAFGIPQFLVTVLAFTHGRWPERTAAAAMTLALIAGWVIPYERGASYQHIELPRLATDVWLFAVFYLVGLWADRFWPLWLSALQLLNVAVHGVSAYRPGFLPAAYHHLIEWISYIMLALLLTGIVRLDRRTRGETGRSP